jgi:predicted Zn-dependent protease
MKGDMQAAARHFEAALATAPDTPRALRELALIDRRYGRNAAARERLAKAVRLEPHDYEVRYAYARVLATTGDPKAAEESRAAEALREEQKHIDALRKSLVSRPDDLDLRSEVARWLFGHGHEQEALDWTNLIISKNPNHPATCRLLAEYYQKKGNQGLANFYRLHAP